MRRVLFVDDEPRILEGLRRMLRVQRQEWEMAFAPGGEAALALMEAAPFDVIVSDMRMPEMDGATLLTKVRDRFPQVVRIVLSGHTELSTTLRVVPVAHQFLAKPCDAGTLRVAIERACHLKGLLSDDSIRRTVGALRDLPSEAGQDRGAGRRHLRQDPAISQLGVLRHCALHHQRRACGHLPRHQHHKEPGPLPGDLPRL